jgi:Ca2+:H+ antiporter
VLIISRLAAAFLLFMYFQLIVFQLVTHKDVFDGTTDQDENGTRGEEDDADDEEPTIPMWMALLGLGLTTAAVTVFSDFLVGSIDEFCNESGVSRTFVGLIILPIVGNAVEHVTAVTVAMKNKVRCCSFSFFFLIKQIILDHCSHHFVVVVSLPKMDLAMGVAVGSCTQISLLVVPLTVLVGWAADKPMTLNFPHFEIILYVLSIFTVSICLGTPRTNWLEGSLLITTYIMIAIGFWFEKVIT